DGAMVGPVLLSGLGAGAGPTAVSVVGDLIDVARDVFHGSAGRVPPQAVPPSAIRDVPVRPIGELRSEYYIRAQVHDRAGVLARLAGVLNAHEVSIEQLVQKRSSSPRATIVLTTHEALERNVRMALEE